MWARVLELALGIWLGLSPFVFRVPPAEALTRWIDFGASAGIAALALASFWRRARRAHLLLLVVAAGLVVLGWLGTRGGTHPPEHQNHLVVGLLLAMLALVPSEASRPPVPWRA